MRGKSGKRDIREKASILVEFLLPECALMDVFGNQLVKCNSLFAVKLCSLHRGARKMRITFKQSES